jgi:hypothetical protein
MRMQSDAASRPQDQADFAISFQVYVCAIYRCGAADARGVGRTRHLTLAYVATDRVGETSLLQSRIFVQRTQP